MQGRSTGSLPLKKIIHQVFQNVGINYRSICSIARRSFGNSTVCRRSSARPRYRSFGNWIRLASDSAQDYRSQGLTTVTKSVALVMLSLAFCIPTYANASVIYTTSGTIDSISTVPTATIVQYQWQAPTLDTVKAILVYTTNSTCVADPSEGVRIQLATPGADPWNSYAAFNTSPTMIQTWSGGVVCRYSNTTGVTLVAGNYYNIHLSSEIGAASAGVSTDVISGVTKNWNGLSNDAFRFSTTTPADLYFSLCSDVDCGVSTTTENTRITQIYEPLSGSITATNAVTFHFDYFNADGATYQYEGYELKNITDGVSVLTQNDNVISSGFGTFSTTTNLSPNKTYMWRPFLSNDESNFVYGDFKIFHVISNPNPNSSITLEATTTDMEEFNGQFAQYFNLISLIQNKYPVSYIPQMITVLNNELTSATTTEFPSLELEFDYNGTATVTLDAFSTTTIVGYLPDHLVDQWKTLISYILYISFFSFIAFDFARMFRSKYD